jgi:hypothetical protein
MKAGGAVPLKGRAIGRKALEPSDVALAISVPQGPAQAAGAENDAYGKL